MERCFLLFFILFLFFPCFTVKDEKHLFLHLTSSSIYDYVCKIWIHTPGYLLFILFFPFHFHFRQWLWVYTPRMNVTSFFAATSHTNLYYLLVFLFPQLICMRILLLSDEFRDRDSILFVSHVSSIKVNENFFLAKKIVLSADVLLSP